MEKKELPENFKINPVLAGKYENEALFKAKLDRANHILRTVQLPDVNTVDNKSAENKKVTAR